MTASLLEALQLPDSCRLGARITKKMLLENAKAMPADRKAITNDVESVVWHYTLKPSTIAIMPYVDDDREYDEIAAIEVTLRSPKSASRIAEVVHRAVPYPVILILRHETEELLSLAPKRLSKAEKGATVVEEFVNTGWLEQDALSVPQSDFVASIALSNLPQSSYLTIYGSLVERVVSLKSACRTGEYHVVSDRNALAEQRRLLAEADELEAQIREYRTALKNESQFNRKVELNTTIKRLEAELGAVTAELESSRNGA